MPEAVTEQAPPAAAPPPVATTPPAASAPPPAAAALPPADPAAAAAPPPADEEVSGPWDGWREKIAGNDEKMLSWLKRFASYENFAKSAFHTHNQVKTGNLRPIAGEGATEAEIAQYRKAWGVPEKPDDYKIDLPVGVELGDSDKAHLNAVIAAAHAENMPPKAVNAVVQAHFAELAKAAEAQQERIMNLTVERITELQDEYGRDFKNNVKLGTKFVFDELGQERASSLMQLRLADGTMLKDYPDFARLFINTARKMEPDGIMATTGFDASAGSVDDQYQKAIDLQFTDPRKFHSEAHQQHLLKLAKVVSVQRNRAA